MPDDFGVAVVVQGEDPAVFAQHAQEGFGRIADLCESGLLEADVDAVVVGDAGDVCGQTVPDGDGSEDLVAVDHAPVAVVDDDSESDRAFRSDEDRDLFAGFDGDEFVVDECFEFSVATQRPVMSSS